MSGQETQFAGPIPEIYDTLMVPLVFQGFAEDLAERVAALAPATVLETAAGTGVVTRALAPRLGPEARYVVSDLSPPMLNKARARQGEDARLDWQVADALDLPFESAAFDALCCQFGVMFFPDRRRAFAEAQRVLKPGAPLIFSVWDGLAHNPASDVVAGVLLGHFTDRPFDFFQRVPFGYHDPEVIRADLAAAGFGTVTLETVTRSGRAGSARDAAVALIQGTPTRAEIAARDPGALEAVTGAAERALAARFGAGPFEAQTQALIVTARA